MAFQNYQKNPLEETRLWPQLTHINMLPILKRGYKKGFTENDLVEPLHEHKSCYLGNKLEKVWQQERTHKNALFRVLFKIFGLNYLLFGLLIFMGQLISIFIIPVSLRVLIRCFNNQKFDYCTRDIGIHVFLIVLSRIMEITIFHHCLEQLSHITVQIGEGCTSLLYRKLLKLNQTKLLDTPTGHLVALLMNDLTKFDHLYLINTVWISPLVLIIGTYLLYEHIETSVFYGLLVLFSVLPIQGIKPAKYWRIIKKTVFLSKLQAKLRLKSVLQSSKRMKMVEEIVSGIQMIKMYCWEKFFDASVSETRRKEININFYSLCLRGMIICLNNLTAKLAIFVSITAEVLRGRSLDTQKAFTTIVIFSIMEKLTLHMSCVGLIVISDILVSLKRIQNFLLLEEKKPKNRVLGSSPKIFLKGVTAKWGASSSSALENINLSICNNQLTTITGPVGCGKSTLFSLLLEELQPEKGLVEIVGEISYSSQEPWLFPDTVKKNILFCSKYVEERYRKVVEVCALGPDFDLLPQRDETLVGNRGISLSGGQKARINLARCIYKDADIYLLDDPLSAVDAHVGKKIYEECIKGFLKEKICVLITHQKQFLYKDDVVVRMENGKIVNVGRYEEVWKETTKGEEIQVERGSKENKVDRKNSDEDDRKESEIEEKEDKRKFSLYAAYLKLGGISNVILAFFMVLCAQSLIAYNNSFVAFWLKRKKSYFNETVISEETNRFSIQYTGITIATLVINLVQVFCFMFLFKTANKNLHSLAFRKLIRGTMKFFNDNTTGKILNRLGRDLNMVDEFIPYTSFDGLLCFMTMIGVLILYIIIDIKQIIPAVVFLLVLYFFRNFFVRTGKDCKRVESLTRNPVYNLMVTSLEGLPTIRTFSAERDLIEIFDNHHDRTISAAIIFNLANRFFGFWVDVILSIFQAATLAIVVFCKQDYTGADVGLMVSQHAMLMSTIQWGLRQISLIEGESVCAERLFQYTKIKTEPEIKTKIQEKWPETGQIDFKNVSLKYKPEDPPVLKNLNFFIKPGEKVGIVGRTGAGKSSLITTLFQLYPTEGAIIIDGVNIDSISLHTLRTSISIIPQEPVLFSGTIRKNLDPFDEYSDEILWQVLTEVNLDGPIADLPGRLAFRITERGANFSVGQRQLLCLARALIRKNKILVMDEATANVDPDTDELIHSTVKKKFEECTVLTIAHRLLSVMDSDRILVMDAGRVEEFDHPWNLLKNRSELFYNLAKDTGDDMFLKLVKIARENYYTRMK